MAAALPFAALAMQVGGTLIGASEEAGALRRGRDADYENARRSVLQGEYEAMDVRRDERAAAGDLIAGQAGGGFAMGSGSAADLIAQSAYHRELDILNIRRSATGQANELISAGNEKGKAARGAMIAGLFGAASQALGGISNINSAKRSDSIRANERSSLSSGAIKVRPRVTVLGGQKDDWSIWERPR